jgi:ComF family protein
MLLTDAILTLAYPQSCHVCGGSVEQQRFGLACEGCWNRTWFFREEETIRPHDANPFAAARAVGLYEGALRASVLLLKRKPHLSRHLATLLDDAARRPPLETITKIVPVPLHADRMRARGFNQASVVAQALSKSLLLPLDEVSLVRVSSSEKLRAGLDAKGRRETVANAFEVRHPRLVQGENILLVDDVFTTGATVSSCAEVLRASAVKSVFVLTIARARS